MCPWESIPADDTSLNVSSSGRHAKESPEVGPKGPTAGGSGVKAGTKGLIRRGSDPTLLASANKTATPTKMANTGISEDAKHATDESTSPKLKLKPDHSLGGSITSSDNTKEKSSIKKPSCKERHHRHHHHHHSITSTSITARAVLAPSAIENSLAGRAKVHQGKPDNILSAASAISSTTSVVGGALVDPGAPTVGVPRMISKGECGKEHLESFSTSPNPSSSASSHHHHHHHHHHSTGASRRTKNRSKRKKTSKGASASTTAVSGISDGTIHMGHSGESSAKTVDDTSRVTDDSKASEGSSVAKQHPKPHHQHSTSSLLSSSVRVPASLLGSVAQSIDGGSMPGCGNTHNRKGSTNAISSAAASMAMGMMPPSISQVSPRSGKESKPTDPHPISHTTQASQDVAPNLETAQAALHLPGQHHHHRHHHHGHSHGHLSEAQPSASMSDGNSMPSTINFPGTSSKCTQTKLEDEEDTLIPTSPTLARQSPMLVGGTLSNEDICDNSGILTAGIGTPFTSQIIIKSNTILEQESDPSRTKASHHCYPTATRQQGTSVPSEGYFISKNEPTLSAEHHASNVAMYAAPQNISQSCIKTDGLTITTRVHGEAMRDAHKDSLPRHLEGIDKGRGSMQPTVKPDIAHGRQTKLDDSGPGPPCEKLLEGEHVNQQLGDVESFTPKAIVDEELQEEGACSASKTGDKTTADTSKSSEEGGGARSSTTQTVWKSSTEVCPWEDE